MTGPTALIDLSMVLSPGMPTNLPDHGPPVFAQYASIEANGWEGTLVTIDTHCATHVDALSHFVRGGATLEQIPLETLIGPASRLALGPTLPGRAGDVPQLPPDLEDRVVLHTGWSDRYAADPEGYFARYTHLAEAFAERLVAAGVKLVGIDTPSVDGDGDAVHHILLGAGVIVVENLTNTGRLPDRFELTVLPLKFDGLDGSPARAVARVAAGAP